MAFDLRNWSRVTDSMNTGAKDLGSLGRVNAPAIFSYRSDTDTQGQIALGNYFGAEAQNISPQDIIWATASNGVVQYRVTAVDRAAFWVTIQAISGGSSGVSSVTGTANEVEVDNTDSQNPVIGFPSALDIPGTLTVQNTVAIDAIIDDDTMTTATDTNVPTSESVKAYVDGLDGGNVKSVTGTVNEISVNNTDPKNPVVGLSSTLDVPGTLTVQGTTSINAIIDDDTMATASATNIPTAESVKEYIDNIISNFYEEGNWTPELTASIPGTPTYGAQTGHYSKIGNMVTVWFSIGLSNLGGIGGGLRIKGLPFDIATTRPGLRAKGLITQAGNMTNYFSMVLNGYAGDEFSLHNGEAYNGSVFDTDLTDTTSLSGVLTYQTE